MYQKLSFDVYDLCFDHQIKFLEMPHIDVEFVEAG
jgi:hypothetical protein